MIRFPLWMLLVLALSATGFGCVKTNKPTETPESTIDRKAVILEAKQNGLIMDDGEVTRMKDTSVLVVDDQKRPAQSLTVFESETFSGWLSAALADVTGGSSFGLAHTKTIHGVFTSYAKVGGLPEPAQGYHYEAWLVRRRDGMKVLNIGTFEKSGEFFVSTYASKMDLSAFDFYVITLQPDASSEPAEHILEGMIR